MTTDEFSVDHQSERIFDKRTRLYFEEVKSSYTVGNYRSAVVMLWSVVVCDLVFKLQHLAEIYTDETAESILQEISRMQVAQPNSPAWETTLVDRVSERMGLLDLADKAGLDQIRSQRHLAAHPVIRGEVELHRPNRDEVRAMMRAALESVLTKLPLVSKKVTAQMLEDVADNKALLVYDADLIRYLESKYFSRFTAGVASAVFKSIWKLVFRTETEECNINREINWRVLALIASKELALTQDWVNSDAAYYSNISNNEAILRMLVRFFARHGNLHASLEPHAKTSIQRHAAGDAESMLFASFMYDTRQQHMDAVQQLFETLHGAPIDSLAWTSLRNSSIEPEWQTHVRRLANLYYAESRSFDTADRRFSPAVSGDLTNYSLPDLRDLMERANKNSQCYYRGRASNDHRLVRDKAREIDAEFDFGPYDLFVSEIRED